MKVHAPVTEAFADPMLAVPSNTVTMLLASAVPAITGLDLLVAPLRVVRTGALGGVTSTVKMIAVEGSERLPAASFAFAEMVWAAIVRSVEGVKDQTPSEPAVTVPMTVIPS